MFAFQFQKIGNFSIIWGMIQRFGCTKVGQFLNYQVTPNSQKVPLASFHMEGEATEWWQWLKHVYKEEDEKKFLQLNLWDKVPSMGDGMLS